MCNNLSRSCQSLVLGVLIQEGTPLNNNWPTRYKQERLEIVWTVNLKEYVNSLDDNIISQEFSIIPVSGENKLQQLENKSTIWDLMSNDEFAELKSE